MRLLAWTFAACLTILAGCGSPGGDGSSSTSSSTAPVDSSTYAIVLEDFPAAPVEAGANLTFKDRVTGSVQAYSDHIGAHFGRNTTTAPSTTVYNVTCAHQAGTLPGVFTVTCAAPQDPGTYFLRGHARITQPDGTQVSWWSEEHPFTVVPLQD